MKRLCFIMQPKRGAVSAASGPVVDALQTGHPPSWWIGTGLAVASLQAAKHVVKDIGIMVEVAVALALLIGVLLGMLGGGGSVLLVPVLLYVLKLEPKVALATSQLVMAATTSVAVLLHIRAGRVVFGTGVIFGLSGMLGSYLGGRIAHLVPSVILLSGFIGLMLVSAVQMLRAKRPSTTSKREGAALPGEGRRQIPWMGAIVGFPTGLTAGMLGAGGGFLVVPALTLFGGLPIQQAVGTSLLVIAMQSFAGSMGYLGHSSVDLRLVAMLSLAMGTSSVLGGFLSQRVPALLLRKLFAGLLLAVAALMLLKTFL